MSIIKKIFTWTLCPLCSILLLSCSTTLLVEDAPPPQIDGAVYYASRSGVYAIKTNMMGTGFQTPWGIVTNSHAVQNLSKLQLVDSARNKYKIGAHKIDCSEHNNITLFPTVLLQTREKQDVYIYDWGKLGIDLALIRARAPGVRDMPLASGVRTGETVFAVCPPGYSRCSPSTGIVDTPCTEDENGIETIESDINVSFGQSGSPLLNTRGEVVGIICGITHLDKILSIHIDELRSLLETPTLRKPIM